MLAACAAVAAVRPVAHDAASAQTEPVVDVGVQATALGIAGIDVGGERYHRLTADGMAPLGRAGWPALPSRSVLVGIPPTGEPELRIEVGPSAVVTTGLRVVPAPRPADVDVAAALAGDGTPREAVVADPAAYEGDAYYPAEPVVLEAVTWVRDQRVARLVFHPYRFRPSDGALLRHETIRAILSFPPDAAAPSTSFAPASAAEDADPLEPLLRRVLVNHGQATAWRAARAPIAAALVPDSPAPSEDGPVWNLHVAHDGMVRVSGARLREVGLPTDADPARLAVFRRGAPVAAFVEGGEDGVLDDADGLVFYGEAPGPVDAPTRVYQLALDAAGARRMPQAAASSGPPLDAVTATVRLEPNLEYVSELPRDWQRRPTHRSSDDRWYWRLMTGGDAFIVPLPLPGLAPGDAPGRLRVGVVGKTRDGAEGPDHHLRAHVGGEPVGEWQWSGREAASVFEAPIPAGLLAGGLVDVALEAPGGAPTRLDQFWIDFVEVSYLRRPAASGGRLELHTDGRSATVLATGFPTGTVAAFDVTDPLAPRRIAAVPREAETGSAVALALPAQAEAARYLAVAPSGYAAPERIEARPRSDLRRVARGADWIAIVHPSLAEAVAPLAAHRRAQGLRAEVVDTAAIYDAFAGGDEDPDAIRSFVAHAYAHWAAPPPSYVVLVGDGTYDPRGDAGGLPTLLPPYLAVADPWLGEVASDNAYAAVGPLPDWPMVALGRLPANSPEEAAGMVAKIVAYEAAPAAGDWRHTLLFVADAPDPAGDFHALSSAIESDVVPLSFDVERVYYKGEKGTHAERGVARQAILDAIGRGALLTQYVGHGRKLNWAVDSLLRRADMATLGNGPRQPVMLDMTCMTGRFHEPTSSSIAEEAVRVPEGGAIAAFSPTGFGVATGHDVMNRAFIAALLADRVPSVGLAALAARLAVLLDAPHHADLVATYVLLGDPALRVALPETPAEPTAVPTPPPTAAPSATITATLPVATASATPEPTIDPPTEAPTAESTATPLPTEPPTEPAATAEPTAPPKAVPVFLPLVFQPRSNPTTSRHVLGGEP